jgi:hypothetical protein
VTRRRFRIALAVRRRAARAGGAGVRPVSGGNRYELHFEMFDFDLPRDRRQRNAALVDVVQRFADRLAHFAHMAPYNWFNLYDFWDVPFATNDAAERAAADGDPSLKPGA